MEDVFKHLNEFGVKADEIYSVRFSSSCREEESYRPALSIPLSGSRIAHISGELEDVTPKGLLAHAEGDLKSLVKVWPLYLIYRCLNPENRFLLLTKKGKEREFALDDPQSALASYLEYYLLARQRPSPLMPQWAKAVLEGGEEDFRAAMEKENDDRHVKYLKRRESLFDPKEALALWSTVLNQAFSTLIRKQS